MSVAASRVSARRDSQCIRPVATLQEEKELGWGGFDDVAPALKTTVVLKRMFATEEFEADSSLRDQLQDDVAVEARKFGASQPTWYCRA